MVYAKCMINQKRREGRETTWGDGRLKTEIAVISSVILWKVAIKTTYFS